MRSSTRAAPARIAVSTSGSAGSATRCAGSVSRRGDRVALLMPDVREYLEADYAIMSAGLVRVPLDPRSTRADLVALLRHAGARALVTHGSLAEAVDGLSREVESVAQVVIVGGGEGRDYEALLARRRTHRCRIPTLTRWRR